MASRARGGVKPLDVGTGVVCASFGRHGAWLSLGGIHPMHGFIELSGAPAFDEELRGQPDAVRRYRALLADESTAFLRLEGVPAAAQVSFTVESVANGRSLLQRLRLQLPAGEAPPSTLELVFRGRLDRPALAMITEVDTPAARPAPIGTELSAAGSTLRVLSPALAASASITVSAPAAGSWEVGREGARLELGLDSTGGVLEVGIEGWLDMPAVMPARTEHSVALPARAGKSPLALPARAVPQEARADLAAMAHRALRYVRECTALRVAHRRLVLLTDHRLLPLSWTRDAYYQALLLLRHGELELVADHLRWLWLDCNRPAGSWARSHLANGARKDEVYQADQQLYPLLELADYQLVSGELPALDPADGSWAELVTPVLEDLLGRRSGEGLLPTDENAADDPAGQPFLLANQVLGQYTFRRLAPMCAGLGLGYPLETIARELRETARAAFLIEGPRGSLWAYSIDGHGGAELYHDANDVPTALAPLMGFCPADDPRWRRTMDFAFSPANDAYAAGPLGGLGSAHTPGVWPLGLIQEWAALSLMGRMDEVGDALRRLVACAMSDGSLPEASDPATGRLLARPWFAWPGALLGVLLPIQ